MHKENCFYLGHFSRKHGIQGELVVALDTDQPENYYEMESVLVEQHGELVPFFIAASAVNSRGQLILDLEEIQAEEDEQLVGAALYLPLSQLAPLEGKQFYFHEVLGWPLYLADGEKLGTIQGFVENSAQALFEVQRPDRNQPLLLPAIDPFIAEVNREQHYIQLQELPAGLTDL